MKRVLMIAYAFPPMNSSGSARPFYFAKYLPECGFRPIVVTRTAGEHLPLDEQLASQLSSACRVVSVDPWDGDDWRGFVRRIARVPIAVTSIANHDAEDVLSSMAWFVQSRLPGARDWIHWSGPALMAALDLYKREPYDLIWATGDPWSSLVAAYWLKYITGLPFVADIRDPWTYGCLWHPTSAHAARREIMKERRILRAAARIVYTSPLTTDIMRRRVPSLRAERFLTITNGFEEAVVPAKRSFGADKCVFCFIGNAGMPHRRIDVLLKGFRLARENRELARDVRLHIIGHLGQQLPQLQSLELAGNAMCTGRVPYSDSRAYMRGADVLVLLQAIRGLGADVISGKSYEYLAAQKPILGVVSPHGGDAWVLGFARLSLITGIEDAASVADGIHTLWSMWREKRLALAQSNGNLTQFTRRAISMQLARVFDEVLDVRNSGRRLHR